MKIKMSLFEKNIHGFKNNIILTLIAIGISSMGIRLFFFPYDIPITEDGLLYFRYAIDTHILGHFPNTPLTNNGWSLFVSLFFSMIDSNNFLDYMTLQRILSVSISTLTIIPVYLLARKFFEYKYALLGAFLFAFEPRIIQNSLFGISDPLYILLVTLSLAFFLSSRKEIIYLSFGIASLATQVRYEGMMLFFLISILYFIRFRKNRKNLMKYGIALSIFILVLLPMAYTRINTTGNDGIIDSISGGVEVYGIEATSNHENQIIGMFSYIFTGFQALIKYLGWIMIPYFVLFVPFGLFLILKKKIDNRFTIILTIIILSIPALYAYSRGIQETRYLYVLYPIFCILSIFTIKFLEQRIKKIILIVIIGVLISSIIFLTIKSTDYEHERESFEIAKHITTKTNAINGFNPESKYIRVTGMIDEFPVLSNTVSFGPSIFDTNYESLKDFINSNRKEGLEHLVVDERKDRAIFLNDIFINDKKYPYLTKVFDSIDFGFSYHVKMYKIEYEKFDLIYDQKN